MKIVIDIPEKTIAHIRSAYGHGKGFYPLNEEDKKIVNDAIYFGTPLSKEHGDLVDRDAINDRFDIIYEFAENNMHSPSDKYFFDKLYMCLNTAPTIIEAEGSESE